MQSSRSVLSVQPTPLMRPVGRFFFSLLLLYTIFLREGAIQQDPRRRRTK